MKLNQTPLYDRVIVQRLDEEKRGLIEVVGKKEKPMKAKVIAVGPGAVMKERDTEGKPIRIPLSVKPGDTVLIGKYSGTIYEEVGADLKTTEYVIVREEDILTVFQK